MSFTNSFPREVYRTEKNSNFSENVLDLFLSNARAMPILGNDTIFDYHSYHQYIENKFFIFKNLF